MNSFQVLTPNNIEELEEALNKVTSKSKVLAGGTDLVINLYNKEIEPDLIIDLSGINDLRYINKENNNLVIGSTTTFTDIAENELVNKYAPFLVELARKFGSEQVRNRATIGGNIATCSPAGDSLPALLALDATVDIMDKEGEIDNIPLEKVLIGPGKTILKNYQVIVAVKFPIHDSQWINTFVKLGTRAAVTIARINLAVNVQYDSDTNTIRKAKVGLGAVGKTAFRATSVEELLKEKVVSSELRDQFADYLSKEVQKSIPGRSTLPYKEVAVKGVAYQAFDNLFKK